MLKDNSYHQNLHPIFSEIRDKLSFFYSYQYFLIYHNKISLLFFKLKHDDNMITNQDSISYKKEFNIINKKEKKNFTYLLERNKQTNTHNINNCLNFYWTHILNIYAIYAMY